MPCINSNCSNCVSNIQICQGCDTANQYLLQGNTCIHVNDIPDLSGADWSRGLVVRCLDANCQSCQQDFRICSQCKANTSDFYFKTLIKLCCMTDGKVDLQYLREEHLIRNIPISAGSSLSSIKSTMKVEVAGCNDCIKEIGKVAKATPDSFNLEIRFAKKLRNHRLILSFPETPDSPESLTPSACRQYELRNLTTDAYDTENRYKVIAQKFSASVKSLHFFGSKILLTWIGLDVSLQLHVCLSFISILRLVKSPYLGLSTWLINQLSSTPYFGFKWPAMQYMKNLFYEQDQDCNLPSEFRSNQVYCSIFANYLGNFSLLAFIFLFAVIVSYLLRISKKKISASPFKSYSMRWPVSLVYGSAYEIVAYCTINAFQVKPGSSMITGAVGFALCLSAFYSVHCYIDKARVTKMRSRIGLPDMKTNSQGIHIMQTRLFKMVLSGFLAALLIDRPALQSLILLLIEIN